MPESGILSRPGSRLLVVLIALAILGLSGLLLLIPRGADGSRLPLFTAAAERVRQELFEELQPVRLANCQLQRFGEPHDGGYLMCGNLLDDVTSAYSYGISGYDGWGCEVSTRLDVPVHQYDCFDLRQPACLSGRTIFHPLCVGGAPRVEKGRRFETLDQQIAANGDAGKRLVVKMDVEGSEWASLEAAPDELLRRIDQLAIEFHGAGRGRYLRVIRRLKQHFYVAHLHFNNYSCTDGTPPFPAWAYEVLFVSRRLGVLEDGPPLALPHPQDAPNDPAVDDCQVSPAAGSSQPPR